MKSGLNLWATTLRFNSWACFEDKELATILHIEGRITEWRETRSKMFKPPSMTAEVLQEIQSALDIFNVELKKFNELKEG